MPRFRISCLAEADLAEIAEYTLRTWSERQAIRYPSDIENCCQMLADHPGLGRACDDIYPGLRRMEHSQHVVFYVEEEGGILVARILHHRMLPARERMFEEEDGP